MILQNVRDPGINYAARVRQDSLGFVFCFCETYSISVEFQKI